MNDAEITQTGPRDRPTLRPFRVRDPVSLLGLVAVLAVTLIVGTLPAIGLSVLLILVAVFLPSSLAFVAGQLALLPALTVADPVAVGVSQLALLAVLTEPARTRNAYSAVVGTVLAYVVIVALLLVGLRRGPVVAGGLVCLAVAFGTYLVRRITLVRLGLVGDEPATETRDDDDIETDRSATRTDLE